MEDSFDVEWQTFISQYQDFPKHSPERWNVMTLLAYTMVQYKKVNQVDYIFAPNKHGPNKCKEMRDMSKIWKAFDQGRYKTYTDKEQKIAYKEQLVDVLKEYIDWIFYTKFSGRLINITSFGLLGMHGTMNEFFQYRQKKKSNSKLSRGTKLSEEFISWVNQNHAEVLEQHQLSTLDDLKSLQRYVSAYKLEDSTNEKKVVNYAKSIKLIEQEE